MSTDTVELEAEAVEPSPAEEIEATPPEPEVGDPDPEVADPDPEEIARAENDGMVAVEPPKAEPVTSGTEWELSNIIEVNRSVLFQRGVVEEKADDLKQEKKELERLQDQLNALISRIDAHHRAAEPDPKRFPLFDKKEDATDADKAAINAAFPAPEAIQPQADTLDQFMAIRARATRLADLKLGKRSIDKLEAKGVTTVHHMQGKSPQEMGLTEKQQEELDAVMSAFWEECTRVWEQDHPEAPAEGGGTAVGDEAVEGGAE
jgi:uncharacterized coiled-coil protein SlyX